MPQTPQITAALPTLVGVSGTASGLGTHIAKQLVGSGVMTIGVDIAVAPNGMNNLYVHVQGDVARDEVWAVVLAEIKKANPATIGLVTSARLDRHCGERRCDLCRTTAICLCGFKRRCPTACAHCCNGSCAPGSQGQCAQSRSHARWPLRAPYEVSERSGKVPCDARRAAAERQDFLDPSDVAKAALFLLSDASAALNGCELIADGGLTTSFDFRTGSEGASI